MMSSLSCSHQSSNTSAFARAPDMSCGFLAAILCRLRTASYDAIPCDGRQLSASPGVAAMKTIVSTLIALAVLAGIAAPASAFDTKGFYQDLDRRSGGTAN